MKILVLGDIHSNWPALAAVAEAAGQFDACLVTGDLVDYGVTPVPCLKWVMRHATAVVRGNHDHAVAQRVPARGGSGFRQIAAATRPLHWQLLGQEELRFLARMPVTTRLTLEGRAYFLVHGTPRDPLDEYLGDDRPGWESRLRYIESDFVLCGHTHVPLVLKLDNTTVVNPGSVGQPRDGDPRAAFAIIERGEISLHRVEYDVAAAVASLRAAGLEAGALATAERALRTGSHS